MTRHNRHNGLLPVPTCYGLVVYVMYLLRTCYGETVAMDFGLNQTAHGYGHNVVNTILMKQAARLAKTVESLC